MDGAQSGGAIAVDAPASGADFYAFSGQKWLLGPQGSGGLWISPERVEQVWPAVSGYLNLEQRQIGSFKTTARAARRRLGRHRHPGRPGRGHRVGGVAAGGPCSAGSSAPPRTPSAPAGGWPPCRASSLPTRPRAAPLIALSVAGRRRPRGAGRRPRRARRAGAVHPRHALPARLDRRVDVGRGHRPPDRRALGARLAAQAELRRDRAQRLDHDAMCSSRSTPTPRRRARRRRG